jgi:predicted signal transduction protein with EAL and GGDEF domain
LNSPLQIPFSTGIASAPQDAGNSKSLIQKADIALYALKKEGHDCFVNAGEISQAEVFDKATIYQLEGIKIAGQGRQVAQVADILKFSNKKKADFSLWKASRG